MLPELRGENFEGGVLREAQLGAQVAHPHIVTTLAHSLASSVPSANSLGEEGGALTVPSADVAAWIILEYCDRGTLLVSNSPMT